MRPAREDQVRSSSPFHRAAGPDYVCGTNRQCGNGLHRESPAVESGCYAACLTGMKALPQGQTVAAALATHIFNANYGPIIRQHRLLASLQIPTAISRSA